MITVEGLTKTYGTFTAVDDITFSCRPGAVTGFLGPNGAGKSTTLRLMTGFSQASSGRARIGGVRYADIPNAGTQVGVLLDASAQHAGRRGREVLALGATTMGLPLARVDEILERVSLTQQESRRRIRHYSLGMRQRLGIANALLGDPKVLILDEPANGLDPAGIHWMRGLLRDFANDGGTVLLSSHLLHEIEVIADEIIVIGNGRIVANGPKGELLAAAGTYVRATDDAGLAVALERAGIASQPSGDAGRRTAAEPEAVALAAMADGVVITELRPAGSAGLEELFLQLTAETQRESKTLEGATR